MRDRLVELFYENNVRCDQGIEGLAEDIQDTLHINKKSFEDIYKIATFKVTSKMWSVDYAKGYLSCYLNNVAIVSDDQYNEFAKMIDDLL